VTRKRILHCHSTFSLGGKEARAVQLMNAFGDAAEHTVLSAVPDALGARDAIASDIKVSFPGDAAPPLHGKPSLARYRDLTAYMKQFDLVLTYNWGSMDAVGARRVFPRGCPPLIHHEDGFNADEAEKLNWKRNAFRRLMLPTAKVLVVPSQRLEGIARTVWHRKEVIRIPNGIDVAAYAGDPEPGAIPGLSRGDTVVVGTVAGLRPVKNLPRLVRAAATRPDVSLVIVGEGPEAGTIRAEAERVGLNDRHLIMPGFLPSPHRYMGHFAIFALSSDSEQFPISLVEAMAAGLPIVATDVGDIRSMVAQENLPFIVPVADEPAFAAALGRLVDDPRLRERIGQANRAKAVRDFDERAMIARYRGLYGVEA
jgi:L-malate glycosyltransferase